MHDVDPAELVADPPRDVAPGEWIGNVESTERRAEVCCDQLAARPDDTRVVTDPETARQKRASLNDHVRRRQNDGTGPSGETASFDL